MQRVCVAKSARDRAKTWTTGKAKVQREPSGCNK